MKVSIITVGRPGKLLEEAISEYERRAGRYWKLAATTVRAERGTRNRSADEVRKAEAERLLAAVPAGARVVALTRGGSRWSSEGLARFLAGLAVSSAPGAAFVIGGAHGLDREFVAGSAAQLSLSSMTLPHDLARLVLAEQLYRAGTIDRGEPYHKG